VRSEGTPHTPGGSHLFCGGRMPGLALGLVGGGGSAGSVLRSQGTLGPAKLSRCRAKGIRMSTFLCSLRPDPAAASWFGGSMREPDSRRFGMRHRFSEEGLHDLQNLGPSARRQVRHVGRGVGLRSQGTCPSDAFALRAMRDRMFTFLCPLRPSPLPPGVSHGGYGAKGGVAESQRGLRPRAGASRYG
jgi:hypothetical protein